MSYRAIAGINLGAFCLGMVAGNYELAVLNFGMFVVCSYLHATERES